MTTTYITELATKICTAETWDLDDLQELAEAAGMGQEFAEADGETFEAVVQAAAARLGVEV